ncbi:MAG: orotidine 5'-phosphate decarboxylase / HUMPS family protein [Candidatus Heimdallarchaeota archaeon]
MSIQRNKRYVQFAFNGTMQQVKRVLPKIPYDPRIIIEAGTPYIKQYGMNGVRLIRKLWRGLIVADLKITDGAISEVRYAVNAGANAVTVMGSAPIETIDFFNEYCENLGVYSMIDMLGVDNPLKRLLPLKHKPNFMVIHKGRDEETNVRSIIRYKDISKVRGKYDVFIAVAGGIEANGVRKAYFNGADVVILNIISRGDPNQGILDTSDFRKVVPAILRQVGQ